MPNPSSTRINEPSQTVPPCGAMASPNTVISSEPARIGRCARKSSTRSAAILLNVAELLVFFCAVCGILVGVSGRLWDNALQCDTEHSTQLKKTVSF